MHYFDLLKLACRVISDQWIGKDAGAKFSIFRSCHFSSPPRKWLGCRGGLGCDFEPLRRKWVGSWELGLPVGGWVVSGAG